MVELWDEFEHAKKNLVYSPINLPGPGYRKHYPNNHCILPESGSSKHYPAILIHFFNLNPLNIIQQSLYSS